MATLMADQKTSGVRQNGPMIIIWGGEMSDTAPFDLEIGFPIEGEATSTGEAKVRTLDSILCASLICRGNVEKIMQGWNKLSEEMTAAGLKMGREGREVYLHFEEKESPNNVTLLQLAFVED